MTTDIHLAEGKTRLHSKPLRILDWVLKLSWWGLIVVPSVSVIFIPILVLTTQDSTWSITAPAQGIDLSTLSVTSAEGENGLLALPDDFLYLNIDFPLNAGNRLSFVAATIIFIAIASAYWLCIVRLLRQILASVKSSDPFIPSNARRIRVIGTLLICGSLLTTIFEGIISIYAANSYSTSGFDLIIRFDFNWTTIFLGLGILVLSEIFREGARIREDQYLTV